MNPKLKFIYVIEAELDNNKSILTGAYKNFEDANNVVNNLNITLSTLDDENKQNIKFYKLEKVRLFEY